MSDSQAPQTTVEPPKQAKQAKAKPEKKAPVKKNVAFKDMEKPEFIEYRLKKWDEFKKRREEELKDKKGVAITITLPDGSTKAGKAYETTPYDIANEISKTLGQKCVVSKVNGKLYDLGRVLEGDCTLELLKADAPEAQEVYWHSSSHLMGEVMERMYKAFLCKGPPTQEGFYYEAFMEDRIVSENDYEQIEEAVKQVIKEKQPFERLVVTKEEALELFAYNKFKTEILAEKVPNGVSCTLYRCGDLIDPCKGPHLLNSGRIGYFHVFKNSSSYWRADASKESLQRIYAISFAEKKQLEEWIETRKKLEQLDHRNIGKDQELWFFHPLSPGCVFFLPHGQRIFNALLQLMKDEYKKRGYTEVQTPNMFHVDLWKTSGHWDKYAENMFSLKVDDADFALKPMNCPGHCLVFHHRQRSYRELPIRLADFGVLHRNELKGALSGMTRVRRFQQDDAHIFCREDQILDEISACLEFMKSIYGLFGFNFELHLSTRPEKFLGEVEMWNGAEDQLRTALNQFCPGKWVEDKGEGAFYGPKIDILIEDALKRKFQCATIQLDFQLPIRFKLQYINEDSGSEGDKRLSRPVIVHRAILGSLERFMAILTEHLAGKWPFWLSPRQIIVVPVSDKNQAFAVEVKDLLWNAGYWADVDMSANTIAKKVRNAQLSQYNFILVVGAKEVDNKTVTIRLRDEKEGEKNLVEKTLPELLAYFADLKKNFK